MVFTTTGMPILAVVFFAIVALLVLHAFIRAVFGGNRDFERFEDRTRHISGDWVCSRRHCRALNPPHAVYCRMCGRHRNGADA